MHLSAVVRFASASARAHAVVLGTASLLALTAGTAHAGALGPAVPLLQPAPQAPGTKAKTVTGRAPSAARVRKLVAARAAQLRSPRLRQERLASRGRYRDLRGRAALDVGKRFFDILGKPAWAPADGQPGVRAIEYLSPTRMLVEDGAAGRKAVLASDVPLWDEDADGDLSRVSTQLVADGDRLVTRNGLIDVAIGRDPEDGAVFVDEDARLTPVLEPASAPVDTVASPDRVSWTNVAPDTDLSVSPVPAGLQTHHILRGPNAPEALVMEFEIPDGASLQEAPTGGLSVVRDGVALGSVSPPIAADAQGQPVDASLRVDGDRVVIDVAHHGKDLAYPVAVDPTYVLDGNPWYSPWPAPGQGWNFYSPWPYNWGVNSAGFYSSQGGNGEKYVHSSGGAYFGDRTWGWMEYNAPHLPYGQGFVYKTQFYNLSHQSQSTCLQAGIYRHDGNDWDRDGSHVAYNVGAGTGPMLICGSFAGWIVDVCAQYDCWNGESREKAALQLYMNGAGRREAGAHVAVGGTSVFLRDDDAPIWLNLGEHPGNGGWTNQRTTQMVTHAYDPGLGMKWVRNTYAGAERSSSVSGCDGTRENYGALICPREMSTSVDLNLVEGVRDMRYEATDLMGRTSSVTRTVKADFGGPSISLGGALAGRMGMAEDSREIRAVGERTRLTVDVTDQAAGSPRAGVKQVTFSMGRKVSADSWSGMGETTLNPYTSSGCDHSCAMPRREHYVDPNYYPAGLYRLVITATDFAGNVSTETRYFRVASGTLDSVAEGQRISRYVPLQATSRTGQTQATFEWRRDGSDWTALKTSSEQEGPMAPVTSWPRPIGDRLVWDLAREYVGVLGRDGRSTTLRPEAYKPFEVRARFPDGTTSEELRLEYDPSGDGSGNERTSVGPGTVDLQTGSFSVSGEDVSVEAFLTDLKVTRSYSSRERPRTGTAVGPLGPGWTLGIPSMDGGEYQKVVYEPATTAYYPYDDDTGDAETVSEPGYAAVTMGDGNEVVFDEVDSGSGTFEPQPGFEHLRLQRVGGSADAPVTFELTDYESSERSTFSGQGTPKTYEVTGVRSLGTGARELRYLWTVAGGRRVIQRVIAPTAPGVGECATTGTPPPGCRWLTFSYTPDGLLQRISFQAYSGPTTLASPITLMTYGYTGGRLTSATDRAGLTTTYGYTTLNEGGREATLLSTIDPPGPEKPWALDYQAASFDRDLGRLKSVQREALAPATGMATTSLEYEVPRTTADGGPWDMSPTTLAALGQKDLPIDGTAIYGPEISQQTDRARATITYLNPLGRRVNLVRPGSDPAKPRVSIEEHDKYGNVVREMSAENHRAARASGLTGTALVDRARALSTERSFVANDIGVRQVWELGPAHPVRIPGQGGTVSARKHTVSVYDEGRPAGDTQTYNFETTTTVAALTGTVSYAQLGSMGANDLDRRVTEHGYDYAMRARTSTTKDASGQSLETRTIYNSFGLVVEQRSPRNVNGADASARRTVYYTADASSEQDACDNKPQWAGFVCQHRPAAQPPEPDSNLPAVPQLPVTTYTYNLAGEKETETDVVSGPQLTGTRTTTTTFDAAGRIQRERVTASGLTVGQAVDDVETVYDSQTGRVVATRSKSGDTTKAQITRTYDALGRLSTYTDADGLVTTMQYDIADRPISRSDSRQGTRTTTYDARSGDVSGLTDPALGQITGEPSLRGEYDADGRLTAQIFTKAGVRMAVGRDAAGNATSREYVKGTSQWHRSAAVKSVHGQTLEHTSSRAGQVTAKDVYRFDGANRLVRADETIAGKCSVRAYEFGGDRGKNGNRTSVTVRGPASDGACAGTGGKTTTYDHDVADRLTGSGIVYDAFGRLRGITGSMAGGWNVTASYYVNDLAHRFTQARTTTTLTLDPSDRVRKRDIDAKAAGAASYSEVVHYDGDGDEPAFTERTGGIVQREIEGLDGDLAAVKSGTAADAVLQLTDLHGDVVGEAANTAASTGPASTPETDEFGVPAPGSEPIVKLGGTKAALTTPGTTLTIATPSGVGPGDLLLAGLAVQAGTTVYAPAGWTVVPGATTTAGSTRWVMYQRYAASGEPSSHRFALSASGKHAGGITALRNAATSNPVNAVAVASGSGLHAVAPSVTPTQHGSAIEMLVGSSSGDADGGDAWGTSALGVDWSAATGTSTTADRTAAAVLRVLVGGKGGATGTFTVQNLTGQASSPLAAMSVAVTPRNTSAPRTAAQYGYLGGKQRRTSTVPGVIEMGARLYLPSIGRFLQPDPVYGGSLNAYEYAGQDPVNQDDLDGQVCRARDKACRKQKEMYAQNMRRARALAARVRRVAKRIQKSPASEDLKRLAKRVGRAAKRHTSTLAKTLGAGVKMTPHGYLGCNIIKSWVDSDNSFKDSLKDLYDCTTISMYLNQD